MALGEGSMAQRNEGMAPRHANNTQAEHCASLVSFVISKTSIYLTSHLAQYHLPTATFYRMFSIPGTCTIISMLHNKSIKTQFQQEYRSVVHYKQ